jgi:hypothetical protein
VILRFYKWYLHSPGRIRFNNFINKAVSNIVNNRFSNLMKEIFNIGMNYPLYMYSDTGNVYVSKITKGKLEDGRRFEDVTTVDNVSFAMNFRKTNYFKRKSILNKVNKILNGDLVFRYKGILNVEARVSNPDIGVIKPLTE